MNSNYRRQCAICQVLGRNVCSVTAGARLVVGTDSVPMEVALGTFVWSLSVEAILPWRCGRRVSGWRARNKGSSRNCSRHTSLMWCLERAAYLCQSWSRTQDLLPAAVDLASSTSSVDKQD